MSVTQRSIFNALLIAALYAFWHGIFAPLMELEKLWIFNNQYSLYSSLQTLLAHDEVFLFSFLLAFSILAPLVKIAGLALIANTSERFHRAHEWFLYLLETWGKWSMLDVFVVALLFVSVKLGSLANVIVHEGLYWFAGAVILIQVLSVWLGWDKRRRRLQKEKASAAR